MMKKLLVPTMCLFLLVRHGHTADVERIAGDWIVEGEQTVRGKHIRLDGSLILPKGAKLTLEHCTLEIVGDYSRQHSVEWKGGTLVTKNCKVGGFVNAKGMPIHTVFRLYEGLWEATDTTVSYSYGISFHWKKGKGVLRGTRLVAGPRPDAIILSGEAEVTLVDSRFPIGLGVYVNKGGSTTLDLTPGKIVTATYDRSSLLPGVNWRLSLTNTYVPRWFLFVRQIGSWQPPAEITLAGSKDLIISLLGHNLTGRITLSRNLGQPLRVGNVTLKTAGRPAEISMYALYFSGDKTDISITGESHICELMHRGGKLRIFGEPGRPGISLGCTTLELSGNARMEIRHIKLGPLLPRAHDTTMGEVNVTGEATLVGHDISVRNVRFRTEGNGSVILRNVKRRGPIQIDGERIQIDSEEG